MIMVAFKDVKIGYMEPFLQKNEVVAMRTFRTTLRSDRAEIGKYKEDIELWKIADFDEETGDIAADKKYLMGGKDVD